MGIVNRGFFGRRRQQGAGLIPPGQYLVDDFPVLSAGPTPTTALEDWDLTIVEDDGSRGRPLDVGRAAGPARTRRSPSTSTASPSGRSSAPTGRASRWTRSWPAIETAAEYVIAFSDGGYTTNLPLEDVMGGQAWVAVRYDGEDLEPEHGGPARLLVPHLYFWKSAKWVRGLRLSVDDEPGFWESVGYHNYGDPWREQRYWGD